MRILSAIIGAGLVVGMATVVVAQTTPAPTTNPNTKVYAYQKTAPAKAKNSTATMIEQRKADETPPHGTFKWWDMQSRISGGSDGGGL
jgi:hypothetical protein